VTEESPALATSMILKIALAQRNSLSRRQNPAGDSAAALAARP
jgi:hypothetical protein